MKYIALVLLLLWPSISGADSIHTTRQMEISGKDSHTLVIECGAGLLDIKGVQGQDKIRVSADIELDNFKKEEVEEFIDKNIRLKLEKRRNTVFLFSDIDVIFKDKKDGRVNLVVSVPGKLNVVITDGSGAIKVSDISGDLKIDDGSGSIEIGDINGKVTVYDGSGSILIEDTRGRVLVKDGSGSIGIDYIEGDVIVTDASGDMTIQHIEGNVTVTDESGGIDISDVSKEVFIYESGTGEVEIERVKGKITTRQ